MSRVSLSADTKNALTREVPETPHCRAALRRALALFGSKGDAGTAAFRTQRLGVARLFRALGDEGDGTIRRTVETRLRKSALYEVAFSPEAATRTTPRATCDRRMELRGAFLACGSIVEPTHGYHLEFVPPTEEARQRLIALLSAEGFVPHEGVRRSRAVLYFKDVDTIARVLTAIGAFPAVLHIEDVRALKETKNRIHRLVNTEAANVERAADAAARQRQAIHKIAESQGLSKLTPVLRELAELRLAHPTETLAELGNRCRPPVSKPTVGGRMNALVRLAHRLSN